MSLLFVSVIVIHLVKSFTIIVELFDLGVDGREPR